MLGADAGCCSGLLELLHACIGIVMQCIAVYCIVHDSVNSAPHMFNVPCWEQVLVFWITWAFVCMLTQGAQACSVWQVFLCQGHQQQHFPGCGDKLLLCNLPTRFRMHECLQRWREQDIFTSRSAPSVDAPRAQAGRLNLG